VSVATVPRSERIAPDVTAIGGAEALAIVRAGGFIAAIETVAAAVRLSATRVARPGRTFAFRGGLAGGYIPPGGALVGLEIFFGGEWREIALLRTNRRGAFAYRYTFAGSALRHTVPGGVAPHDRLSLRIGRERIELHPSHTMRSSLAQYR